MPYYRLTGSYLFPPDRGDNHGTMKQFSEEFEAKNAKAARAPAYEGKRLVQRRQLALAPDQREALGHLLPRPAADCGPRQPRQHHRRSADKLAETVRSAIRTLQREIRRTITGLELCGRMVRAKHSVCERGSNRDERDRNRSQH